MFKRNLINSVAATALLAMPASITLPTAGLAQIDEIIVTTRKRAESLQSVPIAVNSIDVETIQRQGVASLEDVTKFSTSFNFQNPTSEKDVRIAVRGLSPTRGRSNVAFLVDGIDVTSEAIGTAGASLLTSQRLLNDVERIEAVKGPQSALYGRAAFAGAINYVTKDAPDEFEGQIGAEIAEHDQYSINGSVGGPISDKFGLNATGYYWEEGGQYSDAGTGDDLGDGEGFGGALTANFDPTENIRIKARIEYTDEEFGQRPEVRIPSDVFLTAADLPPGVPASLVTEYIDDGGSDYVSTFGDASGTEVRYSLNPETDAPHEGTQVEIFRASLVGEWDIDTIKGSLTSYTGYIDSDASEDYDWDASDTGFGTQWIRNDTKTEIFSQELRYQSDFDGPIQLALGGNYWQSERTHDEQGMLGGNCFILALIIPAASADGCTVGASGTTDFNDLWDPIIAAGGNHRQPQVVKDQHVSLYGMVEWEITEQWKLTLENRYSEEDQRYERTTLLILDEPNAATQNGILDHPSEQIADVLEGCSTFTGGTCNTVNNVNANGGLGFLISARPGVVDTVVGFNQRADTVDSNFNASKLTLEWTPSDNILLYGSRGVGIKPAGIDVLGGGGGFFIIENGVYDSEEMVAWELGAKTDWSGGFGNVLFNTAVFFQDYTDKQVSVRIIDNNGQPQRRTINAGAAEVWGAEFDLTWQPPIEGLTLAASYTYIDSEYTEFTDFTQDGDTIARVGNCVGVVIDGEDFCEISYAGNGLERSPEHALSTAVSYTRPLSNSDMDWFVEGDAQFQDKRYANPDQLQVLEDYWTVNMRAGLEGQNWEALVFVDNLLEDDTIQTGGNIPDFATTLSPAFGFNTVDKGLLPPKRTVGVRANYKF